MKIKKSSGQPQSKIRSSEVPSTGSPSVNFGKNRKLLLLYVPLSIGILFSLLLFDFKISEGNDDSMYLESAWEYANNFTGYFHKANAPLYPMVLGLITMFTGLNLVLFKFINTLLFIAVLVMMYHVYCNRIPDRVLLPSILLCAVNSHLIYYASQTYTELPYLALLFTVILLFLKVYEKLSSNQSSSGQNMILQPSGITLQHLTAGSSVAVMLLLLSLTRSVAIAVVAGLIIFLLLEKQFKFAAVLLGFYVIFRSCWTWIRDSVWGHSGQFDSQSTLLVLKNPYDPSEGKENLTGYIFRVINNIDIYASKQMLKMLGFRDETVTTTWPFFSLLLVVFFAWCAWIIIKKPAFGSGNPAMKISLLLMLVPMLMTFVVLQVHWETIRLIVVFLPMGAVVAFYGLNTFLQTKGKTGVRIYWITATIIVGSSFLSSGKKAIDHFPVLQKNIAGDKYYGYTPDWENYLRMSEWCADNLPADAVIACRKAPMSFVYGKGRKFFPVYSPVAINPATNFSNPDSVLKFLDDNKITHVIAASIRMNPKVNNGIIINTIQRMLIPVAQKYPGKLKVVKKIGASEEAYLFEVVR